MYSVLLQADGTLARTRYCNITKDLLGMQVTHVLQKKVEDIYLLTNLYSGPCSSVWFKSTAAVQVGVPDTPGEVVGRKANL